MTFENMVLRSVYEDKNTKYSEEHIRDINENSSDVIAVKQNNSIDFKKIPQNNINFSAKTNAMNLYGRGILDPYIQIQQATKHESPHYKNLLSVRYKGPQTEENFKNKFLISNERKNLIIPEFVFFKKSKNLFFYKHYKNNQNIEYEANLNPWIDDQSLGITKDLIIKHSVSSKILDIKKQNDLQEFCLYYTRNPNMSAHDKIEFMENWSTLTSPGYLKASEEIKTVFQDFEKIMEINIEIFNKFKKQFQEH